MNRKIEEGEGRAKNKTKYAFPLIVSSPIPATPILKGQDLVGLVDDLKGPDKGGARRERARKLLEKVNK